MPEGKCHAIGDTQITQPGAAVRGEAQAWADGLRRK